MSIKNKNILEDIFISKPNIANIIKSYTSLESLCNLGQTNKLFYSILIENNEIINNEIQNKRNTLSNIAYKRNFYFDIVNQEILEILLKKTESLYSNFYKVNQKLVLSFFFISLILLNLQGYSFVIFSKFKVYNNVKQNSWRILLFGPSFLLWVLTLACFFIYKIRHNKIKTQTENIIKTYKKDLKCLTENNLDSLYSKLNLRIGYCEHSIFIALIFDVLFLLFPFFIKTIFNVSKFETIYLIIAATYYSIAIIYDLIYLFINKYNESKKLAINEYNQFKKNNPYHNNILEIEANKNIYGTMMSEVLLTLLYFLMRVIFGAVAILYLSAIGGKIDNPYSSSSWQILFIPIYILILLAIMYSVVHLKSLTFLFKKQIPWLIFTLTSSNICFCLGVILCPLQLENKINISGYTLPILLTIGITFIGIHYIILYINNNNKYK